MTVCVDKLGIEPNRKKVISIEYGIRTVTGGHDSNGEGGGGGRGLGWRSVNRGGRQLESPPPARLHPGKGVGKGSRRRKYTKWL